MSDISVQRGVNDIGNTGGTDTTFTAVSSTSDAFETISNTRFQTAGRTDLNAGNLEIDDISGRLELTATDTLTFSRISTGQANDMRFAWELIEYVGPPGGDNEFIVRSRNTVTMTSSATSTVFLDTTPTDINKCVPFITGVTSTTTGNGADDACAIAYINSSGGLVIGRATTVNTTVVQVVVVEFTGANWSVYHGLEGLSANDTGTITLNTASDGTSGSTGSVSSWGRAFIVGSCTSGDEGLDSVGAIYSNGSTTSLVDWELQSGNNSNHSHVVHVVNNPDMGVGRSTSSSNAAGAVNVGISPLGLTDISEAMVIGYSITSGGGTAYGRGWRNYRLTSTTNLEHWCHRSGNTMSHEFQIIDFSGLIDSSAHNLLANDLESSSEVTTPVISQTHSLTANDTSSLSEVSNPVLGQTHDLLSTSIETTSEVSNPALSGAESLNANSIESLTEVSNPSVSIIHALDANNIQSVSEVSTPDITEISSTNNLLAEDLTSLSEISVPVLVQIQSLNTNDIESNSEITTNTLEQVHNFTVQSLESNSNVSTPVITQVHSLLAEDIQSISQVSSPVLGDPSVEINGIKALPTTQIKIGLWNLRV